MLNGMDAYRLVARQRTARAHTSLNLAHCTAWTLWRARWSEWVGATIEVHRHTEVHAAGGGGGRSGRGGGLAVVVENGCRRHGRRHCADVLLTVDSGGAGGVLSGGGGSRGGEK